MKEKKKKKDCNPQTKHDSQEQNKHWWVCPIQDKYHIPEALGIECGPIQLTTIGCIPLRIFPDKGACRINTVPSSLPCLQCCGIISALFVHRGISSCWKGELVGNGHPTSGQSFFNHVRMEHSVWGWVTWKTHTLSLETHRLIEGWSDRELA